MIHLMIIYDVVNIFSMKNYKSLRKLRVGLNWYPGVNWSTTTNVNISRGNHVYVNIYLHKEARLFIKRY